MSVIRKLGFITAFIIPTLVITGYYLGGWWNYLAILEVFLVLPLLDNWVGTVTRNFESPQLPAGYPTMIIIELLPPLWFSTRNTRLEKWHGEHLIAI